MEGPGSSRPVSREWILRTSSRGRSRGRGLRSQGSAGIASIGEMEVTTTAEELPVKTIDMEPKEMTIRF